MNGTDGVSLTIALGIATRGRAAVLSQILKHLGRQSLRPARIVVCHTEDDDILDSDRSLDVVWVQTKPGLAHQRNAILDATADCDVLLFIDDDFLLKPDYVATTVQALQRHPEIVVTTGHVIADGVRGPGLTVAEGLERLDGARDAIDPDSMEDTHNGYGCNMGLRLAPVRLHALRFDENLPLYGWYEDIDFTRRLGRFGRIVQLHAAQGVHLGTKAGRGSGRRLGYSQVINPIYLARKGSYDWSRAIESIGRNIAANCVGSFRPEPYIDRRGRLAGNALALADLIRGMINPRRILTLG